MPKENAPSVQEPKSAPELTPATYELVDLPPHQAEIFVPLTNRSYVLKEITPAQFELLHLLGWPHVKKTRP